MKYSVNATQIASLVASLGGKPLSNAQPLADAINATMDFYSISDSARRVRYFVAQSCFETEYFSMWSENLYYTTPELLCTYWPSRFSMTPMGTKAYAPDYVRNPEKLANVIYAGRYGNGDTASGDGYRFRGRGGFHLTFRSNYLSYSMARYGDDRIVQSPDLVALPQDAMMSAGWFWNNNKLNALADADQFTNVTKIINGSTSTVPKRLPVLNKANNLLTW